MRTFLRSKVTLLFMMLGLLLAIPAIALADTLLIQNDLNVNANATHAPGDSGTANVVLNVTNGIPATDTNGCNANGSNPLTATLSSNNADVTFPSGNTASITGCGVAVPVTYAVAANSNGGTAVISATVSGGRTDGTRLYNTSDTLTVTITPPPNTAPTTPGTPGLASGSSTPNQGAFTLNWTASTDDGKPTGSSVTYTLQHKDANDAGFTDVAGATNLSTNSYTFPAASKEAEGTWTYQVKASDGSLSSAFSSASSAIKVDKSAPSQPNANFSKTAEDTVGGWYRDSVTVSYNGSTDPALLDTSTGSGVASYTADQTFDTSGTHSFTGMATDGAGNESVARTGQVKVDTNAPTFGTCPSGGPFILNSGLHSVGPISASDTGESGVDNANSTLSDSVDTNSIGTKTVTFTAQDNVGHSATTQCTYNVNYDFSGFFRPVDNEGVYNTVKAGQSIPVKFSLAGNQGLSIFAANFPTSAKVPCNATAPQDQIEETVTAGGSSLSYDSLTNQYNYVWKSDKAWASSCRMLTVKLIDGTTHTALFNFTK